MVRVWELGRQAPSAQVQEPRMEATAGKARLTKQIIKTLAKT